MKEYSVMDELRLTGVVPVVVIDDIEQAVPIARAIHEGHINVIELTLRTECAVEAIRRISKEVPEIIVGAGTVLNVEQAKAAIDAGAKFIVSPGLDDDLVKYCQGINMPIMPGTATCTEMQHAVNLGLKVVKLFPFNILGGMDAIKGFAPVFPMLKFMPTGGIGLKNINEVLNNPKIYCAGGSFATPKDLVANKDYAGITEVCKKAVNAMLNFKMLHVGINCESEEEASKVTDELCAMFDIKKTNLPAAFFAGDMAEVMKSPFVGKHGHLAIQTDNMERAIYYFEKRGYKLKEPTSDAKGMVACYFEDEIGGFAFHLRRNG